MKHQLLRRYTMRQANGDTVPPIVQDVLRSPGQSLDRETREFMEPRFGHDFSHVRIHTDTQAAKSARAVNALAYTVGQDVVFGEGQYAPGKTAGKQLLAHELIHTIQQSQGKSLAAQASNSLQISDSDDSNENEAEVQATSAIKGQITALAPSLQGRLGIARLQRQADIREAPPGLPCILTTGPGHLPGTDVLFRVSSSTLTASQKADIAAFVSAWTAGDSRDDVMVDGWASVDGPQPLNWRLSCERAEAVKAELIEDGVPASKVTTFAHGESTEFSTTDLAENRRATITRQRAVGPTPLVPPTAKPPGPIPTTPPFQVCARALQISPYGNHAYIEAPPFRYAIISPTCPANWHENPITGTGGQKWDNSPDPCGKRPTCIDCNPAPGVTDVGRCLRDAFTAYNNPSLYRLLGPNSNTFAGTLARRCCAGMVPKPAALGWVPGWDDAAAPAHPAPPNGCPPGPTCR